MNRRGFLSLLGAAAAFGVTPALASVGPDRSLLAHVAPDAAIGTGTVTFRHGHINEGITARYRRADGSIDDQEMAKIVRFLRDWYLDAEIESLETESKATRQTAIKAQWAATIAVDDMGADRLARRASVIDLRADALERKLAERRGHAQHEFSVATLDIASEIQRRLNGRPLVIQSGYRTIETNARVGGVSDSTHTEARAIDLWCPEVATQTVWEISWSLQRGGCGNYSATQNFVHVDDARVRQWNDSDKLQYLASAGLVHRPHASILEDIERFRQTGHLREIAAKPEVKKPKKSPKTMIARSA